MGGDSGLIHAYVLDGTGGGRRIDWDGIRSWTPDDGPLWVHLDYEAEQSRAWFQEESGVDLVMREALLAEDPRPRSVPKDDGLMVIIRTVNDNEGAAPEDMVSLRMWVETSRVITLRHRPVQVTKLLHKELDAGEGVRSTSEFLVEMTDRVLNQLSTVVEHIDDKVSALEDKVLDAQEHALRQGLARFRRQAIALRRFIAPERELLSRLQGEKVSWLSELDRIRLRESADRIMRLIEELDAARERAAVTQEELASRLSEQMNQRLYTLSVITAIFLPLGIITGVLGVNLGGIPGTEFRWAFPILCGGMVVVGGVLLWLFRRLKWL